MHKKIIFIILLAFSSKLLQAFSYTPGLAAEAGAVFSFLDGREWTRYSVRTKAEALSFSLGENTLSIPLHLVLTGPSSMKEEMVLQENYDFILTFNYKRRLADILSLEIEAGSALRYYPLISSTLLGLEAGLSLGIHPLDYLEIRIPFRLGFFKQEYDLFLGFGMSIYFKGGDI